MRRSVPSRPRSGAFPYLTAPTPGALLIQQMIAEVAVTPCMYGPRGERLDAKAPLSRERTAVSAVRNPEVRSTDLNRFATESPGSIPKMLPEGRETYLDERRASWRCARYFARRARPRLARLENVPRQGVRCP